MLANMTPSTKIKSKKRMCIMDMFAFLSNVPEDHPPGDGNDDDKAEEQKPMPSVHIGRKRLG